MKEITIESILSIINENIEKSEITIEQADEDLSLLGVDSINFIRIIVSIEEIFEIEIPDESLLRNEMKTLNKMVNIISTVLESAVK